MKLFSRKPRHLKLVLLTLLLSAPAFAQLASIAHTGITDETGAPLAHGSECFTPVDNNGTPRSVKYPGGTLTKAQKCWPISNGALAAGLSLVKSTITTPINLCYQMTIKNTDTSQMLVGPNDGYNCIQITGDVDMNTIPPNLQAGVVTQYGPQGLSAYQVAVANGYSGTQSQWLTSLDGKNGILPTSLSTVLTAVQPTNTNLYDSSRKATTTFVDSTTGTATALSGFTATGFVAANAGGQMVSSVDIPGSQTIGSNGASSTANRYDPNGVTSDILINAATGAIESHPSYTESPFILVTGATQLTINTTFQGGVFGPTFWDSNKNFISGVTTYGTCGPDGPVGGECRSAITISIPAGVAYVRYGGANQLVSGTMPCQNPIAVVGASLPSDCPLFVASTGFTARLGIAFYDATQNYLSGISGPIPASTPFTVPAGASLLRTTFAGDPSSNLMVVNGSTVPSSYVGYGTLAPNQIQAAIAAAVATGGGSAITLPLTQFYPAMKGTSYWLPFTDGFGTTATDASGNGKNGTVSGAGATASWLSTGGIVPNGQTITIPNASGLPTFAVCARFPAGIPSAFSTYQYIGSQTAGSQAGAGIDGSYGPGTDHGFLAFFPEIFVRGSGPATISTDGVTGSHCVAAIIGSNPTLLDRIFIDGNEVNYLSQGYTDQVLGSSQLSNAMILQTNFSSPFPSPVPIYSAWGSSSRDASVLQAQMRSEMSRLHIPDASAYPLPSYSQSATSTCAITGTSIDVGFQASAAPSTLLSLDYPCTIYNFAVSGQDPKDMAVGIAEREATVFHPKAVRNIGYNGGPTNGVVNYQESPANAFTDTMAWGRAMRAMGYKTIASTMLSRCGSTGYNGNSGDQLKQLYNAMLLNAGDSFDWVANPAATTQLGADNACSNSTYFADASTGLGTHPNDAGQAFYVAAERAGFEGVYGNANPKAISVSYTQIPSDRFLVATGTFAVTLIDANTASFNSAGKLCVKNAGSGTITLTPVSSETIDGASTATIAAGATSCIAPYIANFTAAGANWIGTPR